MNIKLIIKEKGFSVQEVAEKLGIACETLSTQINGNPTVEMLERIAAAVGCKVGDFFERSDGESIKCPHCGKTIKLNPE